MEAIKKSKRIHSLDSLRAIMMLLGVVLHSSITYGTYSHGDAWIMKSPNATSLLNDYIVFIIHAFRMQIFFLIAGFFGAMLFYERQVLSMIKNRISRIIYPFIVFLFLLSPIILLVLKNSAPFIKDFDKLSNISFIIPHNTVHLWFLYYLILITSFTIVIAFIFRKISSKLNLRIVNTFEWVIKRPVIRLVFFSSCTTVLFLLMGITRIGSAFSFIPEYTVFLYYLSFYLVGWLLYKSKHQLESFKQLDFVSTLLAVVIFTLQIFKQDSLGFVQNTVISSLVVWLFVFGITGLFIRFFSNHSSIMRYVSDSSYWVYLVHLPFTILIPNLIIDWPLPATLKSLIVMVITGIICFVSYHYLVRSTFIGKFLNGRVYTKKLSDIKKAEKTSQLKPILDQ